MPGGTCKSFQEVLELLKYAATHDWEVNVLETFPILTSEKVMNFILYTLPYTYETQQCHISHTHELS